MKSLFTNVPINDVLVILMERLQLDKEDRTAMDPLSICLHSTYFAFEGQVYQHRKGTAIGCPLSPVVANIFMDDFETTALATANYSPTIWKRYADDTFVIWPHGRDRLESFLSYINFRSHHQLRVKFGIVQCLSQRAEKICSLEVENRIIEADKGGIHSKWISEKESR